MMVKKIESTERSFPYCPYCGYEIRNLSVVIVGAYSIECPDCLREYQMTEHRFFTCNRKEDFKHEPRRNYDD